MVRRKSSLLCEMVPSQSFQPFFPSRPSKLLFILFQVVIAPELSGGIDLLSDFLKNFFLSTISALTLDLHV